MQLPAPFGDSSATGFSLPSPRGGDFRWCFNDTAQHPQEGCFPASAVINRRLFVCVCVCVISVGGLHLVLSLPPPPPPPPTPQFLCSPHGPLSSLLACLSCGDIYWWAQCNLCSPSILSCPAASCLKNTAGITPPSLPLLSPTPSQHYFLFLLGLFFFFFFFGGGGAGILEWHPSACLFICPQGSFWRGGKKWGGKCTVQLTHIPRFQYLNFLMNGQTAGSKFYTCLHARMNAPIHHSRLSKITISSPSL